jgi:geranylgeranyl pyrophosphate synthase
MTPDLRALKATVEDALDHHLPTHSALAPDLIEAMRYATLSGGKRLRPLLVCAACTGVGGAVEDALAPACAVEFVHAYSLVHDDLPAMDDDDLRHGLPSSHKRFGEATAILAGDALQALAFETLASAPGVPAEARLRAVTLLSDAVGWRGMVGGQRFDLAAEQQTLPLEHLEALHAAKTGALIRAAVQIGAVVGNPNLDDETFVLLGEFASRIGQAF